MLHPEQIVPWLENASIPISTADCRTCADPCQDGHDEFPSTFDVDMESTLLGTVKPYRRQVVISTGKADWDPYVTLVSGSLAAYLSSAADSFESDAPKNKGSTPGVFTTATTSKITILNGSLRTMSDDSEKDTVLVFPDYKFVFDVDRSAEGATDLWNNVVSPAVEDGGRSLTIPYSCVIMICSHKRRDNRCHIASVPLERGLTHALQSHGWQVDTDIDHDYIYDAHDSPSPQALANLNRALIIRTSHLGGHKYAGNINTPQGNGVWYGRVTPHEVEAIVSTTIIQGKIIPSLLRGGINLSKSNCKSLHDW